MREIKFRAWNKKEKKMVYLQDFYSIRFYDDGSWFIGKNINDLHGLAEDKDSELMQYTGLKDKHGKEIYEGDIVEFNQHATYEKIKADITFLRCSFTAHYHKSKSIEVWTDLPLNEEDQDTMEIIGNIYENPDLLEEKAA